MRPTTLSLLGVMTCAGACQTYDFERVVPLTVAVDNEARDLSRRALKPNVMLLVDNSGSMHDPADESVPACTDGRGLCGSTNYPCPTTCPTRVQEMKRAMTSLLSTSGTVARLGLTYYPQAACEPARAIDQQLPAPTIDDQRTDDALIAQATAVSARIQRLSPIGGTPTGRSLSFVGDYAGLNEDDGRDDFVLLLTDGLPNCSDANTNNVCGCQSSGCSSTAIAACRCTTNSCLNSVQCSQGCLDQDGAVAAVEALHARNIRTIVVGFGADLARGDAPAVLNAMANAGGFARTCDDDADCGAGDRCEVSRKRCQTAFYQARTGDELAAALRKIWDTFPDGLCDWPLRTPPSEARFISVLVNDVDVPSGSDAWEYDAGVGRVRLLGATCAQVENSTTQNPVKLEIRSARKL